jgi:hypothetical protein
MTSLKANKKVGILKTIGSENFQNGSILFVFTLVVVSAYLLASRSLGFQGFPLDDAWIHQTYARNLAQTGQWAYLPGQPSGGSTSPLWTLLLSVGFRLGITPTIWAYFLGGLGLFITALICEKCFRNVSHVKTRVPWIGLLVVCEWRLVWAATSGMETLLLTALVMATLEELFKENSRFWLTGLLAGLALWVRPDGLTLAGPILFVIFFKSKNIKTILYRIAQAAGAFMMLLGPYLLFNQALAGSPWPNTYYAKQMEYAALLQTPLFTRIGQMIFQPFIGMEIILIPGLLAAVFVWMKRRNAAGIAAFLWFFGYLVLYALRLPVTYQHGRYLMPVLPVLILISGFGILHIWHGLGMGSFLKRILLKTWVVSIGAVTVGFLVMGANAYAHDVAIIETEMVACARWIAVNTAPNDLIAAHDIGALGYFGQRNIVDLAGLISPQVIPFIRDEPKLAAYLTEQQVKYLVTFPDWYPDLTHNKVAIYTTGGKFAQTEGGENMAIFTWP